MSLQSSSPSKRLAQRRGSASALDPFNSHPDLNYNPNRVSSSTLTIVRVPPAQVSTPSPPVNDPPTISPILGQRRIHRRPGSGTGNISSLPPPVESNPQPGRLSFAFSSFSGTGPSSGGPATSSNRDRAPSPSSSPRIHPPSPRLSTSSPFSSKPRLTPDQIVDLARQSTSARTLAQAATTPFSGPSSPVVLSHSPTLNPHSPSFQAHSPAVSPATFTPLPDDIYLPFIDRPSEVTSLISSPPDAKLFALLAQTFPLKQDQDAERPLEQPSDLPGDPTDWAYRHLVFHLTKVDRGVTPDTIWAYAARKCIMSHSELIWERVKGALGIPPELDVDWDFSRDTGDDDSSSINTDDISDDEGKAARGHWSDWDAIVDSPIMTRRDSRLSVDSGGGLAIKTDLDSDERITVDTFSSPPPPVGYGIDPENHVNIEPLIAAPASFSSIPPPLSLPSSLSTGTSDGLGDIVEGVEEEEEAESERYDTKPSASSDLSASMTSSDPSLIPPSQIQGLKISTSPLPATHYDTPPMMSPISPSGAIPIPDANIQNSAAYVGSRTHSRTGSFSSIGPFRRSDSSSSIAAMLSSLKSGGYGSGSEADASSIMSELHLGSDPIGDHRVPGNPLFPSNFARLAGGPTLKANLRPGGGNDHRKLRTSSHGAGGPAGLGRSVLSRSRGQTGSERHSWGTGSVPNAVIAGGNISGSGSE